MIEQFSVTVPAPSGTQTRNAYLYLPDDRGEKPLPVLYMFDGQTLFYDETSPFGDSWRMGEILDGLGAGLAVAAVDCDKTDRLTEYSPFPFSSKYGSSEGKGEIYLDWLVQEFMPAAEARFRADGARRFLAGSSMGGLMTLCGLCRYSDLFAGGAALSPSLWVNAGGCEQMILSADFRQKPALYLDYGCKELKNHGEVQKEALARCLGALIAKGVPVTFRLIEGGEHSEKSWRKQIPIFLKLLGLI